MICLVVLAKSRNVDFQLVGLLGAQTTTFSSRITSAFDFSSILVIQTQCHKAMIHFPQ
jgi:hypothetical protein